MPNRFKDFWHGSERQWHKNLPQGECPPCGAISPMSGRLGCGPFSYCADVAPRNGGPILRVGLVCQSNSYTVGHSAPKSLKCSAGRSRKASTNTSDVDDEIRTIVARNWPYLLEKLPPEGE